MVNADNSAVEFARLIDNALQVAAHILCVVSIPSNGGNEQVND
jgi:hypothetical protein